MTPDEIAQAAEDYAARCRGDVLRDSAGDPVLTKGGEPVIVGAAPLTVSGLALALGYEGRSALLEAARKGGAKGRALRRALSLAERYAEEALYDKDRLRGALYSLKCSFGWEVEDLDGGAEERLTGVVLLPAPGEDGA